jgi:hypothetical protein
MCGWLPDMGGFSFGTPPLFSGDGLRTSMGMTLVVPRRRPKFAVEISQDADRRIMLQDWREGGNETQTGRYSPFILKERISSTCTLDGTKAGTRHHVKVTVLFPENEAKCLARSSLTNGISVRILVIRERLKKACFL